LFATVDGPTHQDGDALFFKSWLRDRRTVSWDDGFDMATGHAERGTLPENLDDAVGVFPEIE
jgi:hypothetical protein